MHLTILKFFESILKNLLTVFKPYFNLLEQHSKFYPQLFCNFLSFSTHLKKELFSVFNPILAQSFFPSFQLNLIGFRSLIFLMLFLVRFFADPDHRLEDQFNLNKFIEVINTFFHALYKILPFLYLLYSNSRV